MTVFATTYERTRATRVEVARLRALGYREELTDWQKATVSWLLAQHLKTLPEADRLSFAEDELLRAAALDWSILDDPQVLQAVQSAASTVARRYAEKLSATEEDLKQCARIILAEQSHRARNELAKGYPFLNRWLWQRLEDLVRYEHRDVSLEALESA